VPLCDAQSSPCTRLGHSAHRLASRAGPPWHSISCDEGCCSSFPDRTSWLSCRMPSHQLRAATKGPLQATREQRRASDLAVATIVGTCACKSRQQAQASLDNVVHLIVLIMSFKNSGAGLKNSSHNSMPAVQGCSSARCMRAASMNCAVRACSAGDAEQLGIPMTMQIRCSSRRRRLVAVPCHTQHR